MALGTLGGFVYSVRSSISDRSDEVVVRRRDGRPGRATRGLTAGADG